MVRKQGDCARHGSRHWRAAVRLLRGSLSVRARLTSSVLQQEDGQFTKGSIKKATRRARVVLVVLVGIVKDVLRPFRRLRTLGCCCRVLGSLKGGRRDRGVKVQRLRRKEGWVHGRCNDEQRRQVVEGEGRRTVLQNIGLEGAPGAEAWHWPAQTTSFPFQNTQSRPANTTLFHRAVDSQLLSQTLGSNTTHK